MGFASLYPSYPKSSLVLDPQPVIDPPVYGRQRLGQVFRDQAGAGLARCLAMHPHADAGRLEGRPGPDRGRPAGDVAGRAPADL